MATKQETKDGAGPSDGSDNGEASKASRPAAGRGRERNCRRATASAGHRAWHDGGASRA